MVGTLHMQGRMLNGQLANSLYIVAHDSLRILGRFPLYMANDPKSVASRSSCFQDVTENASPEGKSYPVLAAPFSGNLRLQGL